jgi:hypothetical protein
VARAGGATARTADAVTASLVSALLGTVFGHLDIQTSPRHTSFCGDFSKKDFIRITHDAWRNLNTILNRLLPAQPETLRTVALNALKWVDVVLKKVEDV